MEIITALAVRNRIVKDHLNVIHAIHEIAQTKNAFISLKLEINCFQSLNVEFSIAVHIRLGS